jgi:hypothetical protein
MRYSDSTDPSPFSLNALFKIMHDACCHHLELTCREYALASGFVSVSRVDHGGLQGYF